MSLSQLHLQVSQGERTYDLHVTAVDGGHQVEVTGSDANGEQIAELRGTLPKADLALVVQLLTSGAAALGKMPRTGATVEERRQQHRNSHQPWTDEDDQRLKELAAAPGASITGLMEHFGRSRASIEARLPKVGVEPALPLKAPQ
ncbi:MULTISPECIES: hypothetical protein [Nonomuraea]|uniref:Uncharacterized protein n=1 Tax=Nonomuraea mangrovi TaxID=2316207 RepID=A0ABW4TF09_9ACTN